MHTFLRTLAFPVACAFTGAATALLVSAMTVAPAPACPAAPTLHVRHEMTPLRPPAPAFVAPMAILPRPAPAYVHPIAIAAPPAPEPAQLEIPDGAVRCTEPGRCVLDHGLYLLLRDNPSLLSRQARILPSLKDGQVRGLKFYAIRPGSLPNLLGLKNGDLLTALNGVPVTDGAGVASAEALLALLDVRERPVFSLEIERKGQPVRVNIDVAWQQEQALKQRAGAR